MIHIKVEKMGDGVTATIDAETLRRLGAVEGGILKMDESAITVEAPATEAELQLALARQVMVDYRDTLNTLAQ